MILREEETVTMLDIAPSIQCLMALHMVALTLLLWGALRHHRDILDGGLILALLSVALLGAYCYGIPERFVYKVALIGSLLVSGAGIWCYEPALTWYGLLALCQSVGLWWLMPRLAATLSP